MAESSGFFASVGGDRQYTTDFLAHWIASIIGNGVYNGELAVTAGDGMTVTLPAGRAWINGYYYRNDGDMTLTIDNADGVLNRVDIVVLRWDVNARSITAQVIKGTPASTATAPAITRTAEQYDLKLAEISIPAGTTAITQSLITDTRLDNDVCGIVTGVIDQVDTTTFYSQIQADLAAFKSGSEADFSTWSEQQKASFDSWFNGIKDILGADEAGNLLNLIEEHKADTVAHVTASERDAWNDIANKVEKIADLAGFVGYTEDDIYGVEADFENKKFTRLAGAVNKNPGADFDSIKAFGGRKRCIVTDDGKVLAYYGEPGYVETGKLTQVITKNSVTYPVGTPVQVMVEQPKFYYKVVPLQLEPITDGIGYHLRKARYYVSDTPKVGFKVHPAFVRNGVEVDKIYLSAYEGSIYDESAGTYLLANEQIADFNADKLSSIAYAKPASGLTQNLTRANARKLANNRGVGWQLSDVLSASVTQMLFIIEYASFDTQANIGLGVVNKANSGGNESEITGTTTNLGNASGMADGTNGWVSVTYRGEENFWGNIWSWIDGLNIECKGIHQAYWADHDFQDNIKTSPYKNCGFTLAKSNGYVSAFGYSEDCDFLFLPSETVGNSSLPVGDTFWQNHTYDGFLVPSLGGAWHDGSQAGGFYWFTDLVFVSHDRGFGGRLLYVPQVS